MTVRNSGWSGMQDTINSLFVVLWFGDTGCLWNLLTKKKKEAKK